MLVTAGVSPATLPKVSALLLVGLPATERDLRLLLDYIAREP